MVANAGIAGARGAIPLPKTEWSDVRDILHTNLLGSAATVQPFIAPMVARGRGHLVGISSVAADCPIARSAAYGASKAGLTFFLESADIELRGIEHRVAGERMARDPRIAPERSAQHQGGVLDDAVITEIADRDERTAAQVVLRWHVQRDSIVFPKSVTPARVRENFELFDFELTDADMEAITGLDQGEAGRTGPNPNQFTGRD